MIKHGLTLLNRNCKDVVMMHLKKQKDSFFLRLPAWRGGAGATTMISIKTIHKFSSCGFFNFT
jgi:hypothetical protein